MAKNKVTSITSKTELKLFRLITGEEIIAKVKARHAGTVVIEKPVVLVPQPSGEGQITIGFAPFMPFAVGALSLNVSAVAIETEAQPQLLAEYQRLTSPIIQAPPQGVVGPAGPVPSGPIITPA